MPVAQECNKNASALIYAPPMYFSRALIGLNILWLDNTNLSALPPELKSLTELRGLYLFGSNRFEAIPEVVFELKALSELNLRRFSSANSNRIREVPRRIIELPMLRSLNLEDNPIESPPAEIVFRGISTIREYFAQVERSGEAFLFEAKLLIVGEPGAGKTSLRKKLMNPKYILSDTEDSTEVIEMYQWKFKDSEKRSFHNQYLEFRVKTSITQPISFSSPKGGGTSHVIIVKNEKQDRHREIDDN
jgi:internalin A